MTSSPIRIPDLEILDPIGYGAQSIVYLARRGSEEYALKVGRPAFAEPSDDEQRFQNEERVRRFYREAAALARGHHRAFPKVFDVGVSDEHPYILMELVRGEALSKRLERGPLSTAEALSVAAQLTQALQAIHDLNLVHRDIKPSNILLKPAEDGTFTLKLIDFGFVTGQADENRESEAASAVGTVLYSAPEQIGLLSRAVDPRSDLYSVGAVLFECLSAKPLFESKNLQELLETLSSENPLRGIQFPASVPDALRGMIRALVAKDPDDRPADGRAFLQRLLPLLSQSGISLARSAPRADRSDEAPLVAELFREVDALRRAAKCGILIAQGESGMGKTEASRALEDKCRESFGMSLVARAKIFRSGGAPLSGISQIMDALARSIREYAGTRSENSPRLDSQDLAPLVQHFSPALARVLFPAFDGGTDHHFRVTEEMGSSGVVRVFELLAERFDALVLILDDASNLDLRSQAVLKLMIVSLASRTSTGSTPRSLTAVFWTSDSSALDTLVDRLPQRVGMRRHVLEKLQSSDVSRLCTNYFRWTSPDEALVRFFDTHAQGNRRILYDLFQFVVDEGIILLRDGHWAVQRDRLEGAKLPTNIALQGLARLSALSDNVREVASVAALWGAQFSAADLAELLKLSAIEVAEHLQTLTREQFLRTLRLQGLYEFTDPTIAAEIEKECEGSRPNELRALHQRIGELLQKRDSPDIFLIATHLARGEVERFPGQTFSALCEAGILLVKQFAFADAVEMLRRAESIRSQYKLPENSAADLALGDALSEVGQLVVAGSFLDRAIQNATEPLHRAEAHLKKSEIAFVQVRTEDAILSARDATLQIGEALGVRNLFSFRYLIWNTVIRKQRKTKEKRKIRAYELLFRLSESGAFSAYFNNDLVEAMKHSLTQRLAVFSLRRDLEDGIFIGGNSTAYAVLGLRKGSRRLLGKAREIARRIKSPYLDAYLLSREALSHSFLGEPVEAAQKMIHCLSRYGHWLKTLDYLTCITDLSWNLLLRGHFREAEVWVSKAEEKLEFSPQQVGALKGRCVAHAMTPIAVVLGKYNEAQDCFLKFQKILDGNEEYQRVIEFCAQALFFHRERGDLGEIDGLISRVDEIGIHPGRAAAHLRAYFVFKTYARLEQYRAASKENAPAALRQFRNAIKELKRIPRSTVHYPHILTLFAVDEEIRGHYEVAHTLFSQAERLAKEIDSPSALYEIAVQRAHLFEVEGNSRALQLEIRSALGIARGYGWVNRVRNLQEKFAMIDGAESITMGLSASTTLISRSVDYLDESSWKGVNTQRYLNILLQVLTAATTASSSEEQVRVVLDECLKILNGERAMLFLYEQGSAEKELVVKVARERDSGQDLSVLSYSKTAVATVESARKPVLVSGSVENISHQVNVSMSSSAVIAGLKSILAVPLLFKDQLRGVLYLDSRVARGIFTPSDVQILVAIANQLAVMFEAASLLEVEAEQRALKKYAKSLEETTQMLDAIVNSVGQGFLLFGPDGICLPAYSKACEHLLEIKPAGRRLEEVLKVSTAKKATFQKWLSGLFSGNLSFHDLSAFGPRLFDHSQGRHIELQYFPVLNSSEEISAVVLLATDTTQEHQARERAEKEKKFAARILKIVRNKDLLARLYGETKGILQEMQGNIQDASLLKRHLHTLKGNLGMFGDSALTQWIHDAEDRVALAGQSPERLLEELSQKLRQFFAEASQLTGIRFDQDDPIFDIHSSALKSFFAKLQSSGGELSPLVELFESQFLTVSLQELLAPLDSVIQEVAAAMQKPMAPLKIVGGDLHIHRGVLSELFLVLPHLARNSVVHGIETMTERTSAGKASEGQIQILVSEKDGKLSLTLSDDGKGYDPRTKKSEVRTADLYSGRGVGLGAVEAAVKRLGGQLEIQSEIGRGTSVRVEVPLSG